MLSLFERLCEHNVLQHYLRSRGEPRDHATFFIDKFRIR